MLSREKSISFELPGFQDGFVTSKHDSIIKSDFKVEKSCLAATFCCLFRLQSSSLMTETHFHPFLLLEETSSSGNGGAGGSGFLLLLVLWLKRSSSDLRPPHRIIESFWLEEILKIIESNCNVAVVLTPLTSSPMNSMKASPRAPGGEVCAVPRQIWVKLSSGRLHGEDQQLRKALCLQNWPRKACLGYGWVCMSLDAMRTVHLLQLWRSAGDVQPQVMLWAIELVPGAEHRISHPCTAGFKRNVLDRRYFA